MKAYLRCVSLLLAVLLSACALPAGAEDTAVYGDGIYEFRYPASWTCETSPDGTAVLRGDDRMSAVITFAIRTDMIGLTGDLDGDAAYIGRVLEQYGGESGSGLVLRGECESASSRQFRGFRAFGTWGTGRRVEMVYMSGKGILFLFIFAGEEALSREGEILASVDAAPAAP